MSLLSSLEEFGLTTNEAKVYVTCLSLGPNSIQKIAHRAKLNRVSVYTVIAQLTKKGFVREQTIGNKRRFAAYPPMKLYDLLGREQDRIHHLEESLNTLIPELKAQMHEVSSRTNIIYYEGEEGLKNWASDALETTGELLEWTKIESFSKPFEKYLQSYYFPEKIKRQIPTRFIFLDTPEARLYVKEKYVANPKAPPMKARFISSDQFDTPGFSVIFNDRYSIALPAELRAVTVIDQLIANTQRKIWEFGWLYAKDEMSNKAYPKQLL